MKISVRRSRRHIRSASHLLLLCLGLAASSFSFPSELAATGSRVSVVQSVSQDVLPILEMKTAPVTSTLEEFALLTISKLAQEAPFKDWKGAQPEYYPLGPGTHSWLVNVMSGEQRIGYMIISAADGGGYTLSEYGAGTYGLPYSLSDLRQLLVQEGLISSSSGSTLELTALYSPLLPVWKLSINGKTIYVDAAVPQLLPWSLSKAENVLKNTPKGTDLVTSMNSKQSPRSAYRTGGTDDPYADLLWLTAPKLAVTDADSFTSLIPPGGSIVFRAAGRNDTLSAPFMITGYQSWLSMAGSTESTVYAASGHEGKRYLPLSELLKNGTLHKLPGSIEHALN